MSPMPCLAVEHRCTGTNKSATTVFSLAGKEPIAGGLDSDELADKAFCPTPQGWLIVRDRLATDGTYLLDHHSREKISLPPLAIDQDLLINCSCLLSDAPTAPGCVVLVVEPDAPIIRYHRIGEDDGWTEHEYDLGTQGDEIGGFEKIPMCETVACRGRFYFLSSPTELGVLELSPAAAGPAFSSIAVDGESYNCGETAKAFLVESEEELYMVRLLRSRGFNEANVYKMDFSEQRWRPVRDLGGRAFFVAPLNFGVSCLAGDQYGIQRNCVYSLVKLADKSFNVFNVEDGTAERRDIGEAYVSVAKHGTNPQHPTLGTQQRMLWMVSTSL